jgi:TATA-box binding protein (TBP) (component of TFIID and TFIIIB)
MAHTLKIVNVIAVSDIGIKVDLVNLPIDPQVFYNPQKYGGRVAYIKTKTMHRKVSVFNSGKMISVGTKSVEQSDEDLKVATYVLKNLLKENLQMAPMRIANIVFSVDIEKNIDLERIASEIPGAIYEPEQFPAVILKLQVSDPATSLLFASGKIIINGVKSEDAAEIVFEQINRAIILQKNVE